MATVKKTADAIIGNSAALLLQLRDELERSKALRFFVFLCRCPVLDFSLHALEAIVQLSADEAMTAKLSAPKVASVAAVPVEPVPTA